MLDGMEGQTSRVGVRMSDRPTSVNVWTDASRLDSHHLSIVSWVIRSAVTPYTLIERSAVALYDIAGVGQDVTQAELAAIRAAMRRVLRLYTGVPPPGTVFHTDSRNALVYISDPTKTPAPFVSLAHSVLDLGRHLSARLVWIPRGRNAEANRLATVLRERIKRGGTREMREEREGRLAWARRDPTKPFR